VDVVAIIVLLAGILLGPGPLAAIAAFLLVVAGRALIPGA
jgi:hypothetical protein